MTASVQADAMRAGYFYIIDGKKLTTSDLIDGSLADARLLLLNEGAGLPTWLAITHKTVDAPGQIHIYERELAEALIKRYNITRRDEVFYTDSAPATKSALKALIYSHTKHFTRTTEAKRRAILDELLAAAPEKRKPKLTPRNLADVVETPARFLLYPYFLAGAINLINADGGTGKSLFLAGITAKLTTGTDVCGLKFACSDRPVIICSQEDEASEWRRRIRLSGGQPDNGLCYIIDATAEGADDLTIDAPELTDMMQ